MTFNPKKLKIMNRIITLRAFVIWAFLLCSLGAMAQEAYAHFTESNGTLTFYYDDLRSARRDTTYDLPEESLNGPGWFDDNTYMSVTKVVFSPSFANARPTSTRYWFAGMENLQAINGMQYLNTSEVTDMWGMFGGCISLPSLDLSHFNTEKVYSMNHLFSGCSSLTSLDVSHFNTENVEDMQGLFKNCSGLTTLDVSNFDTRNVYSMSDMFDNCTNLQTLDLSNFNTSNIGSMDFMFSGCYNLTSVDLSSFDTSKATDICSMFQFCTKLKSVDLSSFNTAKVTNMWYMFNACWVLETVYVGDGWSTDKVTLSARMFNNCSKIVGGRGTTYDSSHTDKAYARIDGGADAPGYFTSHLQLGDANGDGQMNITDVTKLIDAVLNDNLDSIINANADVNHDGEINITDITLLIALVLNS